MLIESTFLSAASDCFIYMPSEKWVCNSPALLINLLICLLFIKSIVEESYTLTNDFFAFSSEFS